MSNQERTVREAVAKLHTAIVSAEAAGYVITLPSRANGLLSIAISQTATAPPNRDTDTPMIKNPEPAKNKETKLKT